MSAPWDSANGAHLTVPTSGVAERTLDRRGISLVSTWLRLGSQSVVTCFPRQASHPAQVGESDRKAKPGEEVRKSGCSRSGGGRPTWRSALLPTDAHRHSRARAGEPGITRALPPRPALALGGGECPAGVVPGVGGGVSLPAAPAPDVTAGGPIRSGPLVSPFLRSLGPAGARVPRPSDALGGAGVVPPALPHPPFLG